MEYVQKDNITFIPISNLWNRCCYHVAVTHLLHTSPTLNRLIQNVDLNGYHAILKPLQIYSQVTPENRVEKHAEMKAAYDEIYSKYADEAVINGYSPHLLLWSYMLPVIWKLFPDHFESIFEELGLDLIYLSETSFVHKAAIETSPFLKSEYRREALDLAMEFSSKWMGRDLKMGIPSGLILEVYPNKHNNDGAHALFILKADRFYIFDDDFTIDALKRYVDLRSDNIHKLIIRSRSGSDVARELQSIWGNVMSRFVNNRFEISKGDLMKTVCKAITESNRHVSIVYPVGKEAMNVEPKICGGGEEPVKTYKKPFIITLTLAILLFVILIIEIVYTLSKRKHESYDLPCPCRRS